MDYSEIPISRVQMYTEKEYKNNPKTQETIAMALGEFPGHRHRSLVYVVWNPFDTEEDSL